MKIIIFIGLKIVEIAAIVFVPYYIGKFVNHCWLHDDSVPYWIVGIAALLCGGLLIFIGFMFVATNWEWADKLIN